MRNMFGRMTTSAVAVGALAALGLSAGAGWGPFPANFVGAAWSAETGSHSDSGAAGHEGGHQEGQQKGKGGPGAKGDKGGHDDQHGDTADHGSGASGEHGGGAGGQGQGGPGADSEGKGPRAGAPTGSRGTKPVWAQEGIPEVELGRLNVARSPSHVLQRAYEEALATISPEMVSFYNLSLDQAIEQLSLNFDSVARIDSPLQNLALLKDTLNGSAALSSAGVTNDPRTLEAVFLGTASDKTVPITRDTVIAVTAILGTPVTGAEADRLAAQAEAVRIAVLAGHDS